MKTIMVEYCNSSTEFKVRFDFDKENVNTIKLLDSKLRKYDPDNKCWIIKATALEELKKLFDGYIAIEGGLEEKLDFEPVVFDTNYKISAFKGSFQLIHNPQIRKLLQLIVRNAPDYFFEIPASSTGKYHPKYVLGEGGLLRHTLGAIVFANHLFPLYNFNQLEQDLIIASLIIHDMAKNGIEIENGQPVKASKYSVATHPIAICEYVEYLYKTSDEVDEDIIYVFKEGYWDIIKSNVQSHMGKWNTDYKDKTKEVLPKPVTESEKFVHLCDYLASRKNILVEDLL